MHLGYRGQLGKHVEKPENAARDESMLFRITRSGSYLVPLLQAKAEQHVRDAASQGANIILLQELFGAWAHI
jgi:hypothetical protein